MKGTIFDIKRFAVHDGPGIRTTLFLKGCPLKCLWCHNPEGIPREPRLWYFSNKCMACGLCVETCPSGALTAVKNEGNFRISIDHRACTACGKCVRICPTGALEFDGTLREAEEVTAEVLKDRDFFEESGGGVTLSGGDPVYQPDFSLAVLKPLKKAGIHTAVESSLFCTREVLEKFLPLTDLFIADLKLFSEELHKKYTGVSNSVIKENILYLLEKEIDVLIRIPLIPGFTADDENLNAIGQFLKNSRQPVSCELLNYNPLAENKYRMQNTDNPHLKGLKPFSDAEIRRREELMASWGLKIVSENLN